MRTKVVLALCASLAAMPAQAEKIDHNEACAVMAYLAESIAMKHQEGTSLATVLDLTKEKLGAAYLPQVQPLIVNIYARPRYATLENQQREIAEIRDEVHVACLESDR